MNNTNDGNDSLNFLGGVSAAIIIITMLVLLFGSSIVSWIGTTFNIDEYATIKYIVIGVCGILLLNFIIGLFILIINIIKKNKSLVCYSVSIIAVSFIAFVSLCVSFASYNYLNNYNNARKKYHNCYQSFNCKCEDGEEDCLCEFLNTDGEIENIYCPNGEYQ